MLGDEFREKKNEINLVKLYSWMVGIIRKFSDQTYRLTYTSDIRRTHAHTY